ncbi:hypothetical protein CBS101457_002496 [Exobasidium rhododendri]|nr:hypothetical protein CBS101457_002496 [Exobasidium rhododendri]
MPLTYDNPVINGKMSGDAAFLIYEVFIALVSSHPTSVDFADPGVFFDSDTHLYYGYSTNANGKNVQCCSSRDFCSWELSDQDALPGPYPPWSGKDGFKCWAPEVRRAPEGRPGYIMYFSTHDWNTDVMCIATAYSPKSPFGPFAFVGDGPIVSQGYQGGTIDPQPFNDPVSKKNYLIFKNDGNHNQTAQTRIWIQELSPDGLRVIDEPVSILQPTESWHKNLIEAPYLVYHAPSKHYVLFFSSGFYGNEEYATGYAVSDKLFGPYKPEKKAFLGTDEKRKIRGPGGISVIENGPEGNWMIAFHAHDKKGGGQRVLCVHRLEWTHDGKPILAGKAAHFNHRLTMGEEEKGDETRDFNQESKEEKANEPTLKEKNKKRLSNIKQWIKDY